MDSPRLAVAGPVLSVKIHVGELLHQSRESVDFRIPYLVHVFRLVPHPEEDLLPGVQPLLEGDLGIQIAEGFIAMAELIHVGRIEGQRVLPGRLRQLRIEGSPRIGVGRHLNEGRGGDR